MVELTMNLMIRNFHCFKRHAVLLALGVLTWAFAYAGQPLNLVPDKKGLSVRQVSFAAGSGRAFDTYLSPSAYSGTMASVWSERLTMAAPISSLPYRRVYLALGAGSMHNGKGGGQTWQLLGHAGWARSARLASNSWWDCLAGVSAFMDLGGLYNVMNSNNPVDAVFQTSAGLAIDNMFSFNIRNYDMALKVSIDLPLLGVGFSPDHDQLYWTMYSDGTIKDNFHITSAFNAPTVNLRASVMCPVGKSSLISIGFDTFHTSNVIGGNTLDLSDVAATLGIVRKFDRISWKL